MLKVVYTLIFIFCTQLFVVGQENSADDLLNDALGIMSEDPEEAIDLTMRAFKLAGKNGDSYGMISAKSVMGDISMQEGDFEAAYINFSDALEYLEKSDTVDVYNRMLILSNLAEIKSVYGDHGGAADLYGLSNKAAMEYVQNYSDIAEEYDELNVSVEILYNQAQELKLDGRYLEAGDILLKLWEDSEFEKDTILLAKVVNELGMIRKENKQYNDALEFFAISAFGDGVEEYIQAIAMHNLAETYMEQGDFVKAEKYYGEALEKKMIHSSESSQFRTLLGQGELFFKKGDVNLAIEKWETALTTYDKVESYPDLFVVYDWLQKAYLKTDLQKASVYGDLYSGHIKEWMKIQSSQRNNAPTLQAFNTKIDTILADRQLKAERLALLKRYWPFGVVALLLILLLVYTVQVSFNRRRERLLEESLKLDRASVADEILNRIRRD
ncbi:tetratricopeptide repeat protein [Roseivirga misakiensis]|uniref:MalT-like TPR region domain-containing protein n=1 Tax=Roseivirga misakiensis TaxID=1563681 RepID=A0A1E5T4S7_9BACT|nr:tetratricopeptide repeat protein [Roseivirga misakiensis]OEK06317.1 hypothetical protein BFP71_01175 [Roseivirga misakiensis]